MAVEVKGLYVKRMIFFNKPHLKAAYLLDPNSVSDATINNELNTAAITFITSSASAITSSIVLSQYVSFRSRKEQFAAPVMWLHLNGGLPVDPVSWWNMLVSGAEELRIIALKMLRILASSAAAERNWSMFGHIHSKLRNRLGNGKIDKLVYVNWNLKVGKRNERRKKDEAILTDNEAAKFNDALGSTELLPVDYNDDEEFRRLDMIQPYHA
ncbi:MAG: hypothetical protein FD122_3795 [Stygiobacter sp.]|nr:MAG: hypothetical protein FD122_3795 [Stygiobacter sp.]